MDDLLGRIRDELYMHRDDSTKDSFQRFFKESVTCYGVKTATVGKIAKKYWNEVKYWDKQEIFRVCEDLYRSDYCEEAFIVSFWVPNLKLRFEPSDLAVFEGWISRYINNWAKCDGFCNHSVGNFIQKYPDRIENLLNWAKSDNPWLRRAAAVSLIVPAKRGEFLPWVFALSDLLLTDTEDLVQKGYGWLLKESSRKHQEEVFSYVMKNRAVMPRTALRYAIELMPKTLKTEAMKRV